MGNKKGKLLIIDDDEMYCSVLQSAFERRNYEVATACNAQQATELIESFEPDLAIVDLRLEESSGLHLIKQLRAHNKKTKIVMLTGYASIATAVKAIKLGATQYLTKPANADEILTAFSNPLADATISPVEKPLSVKRVEWEHMQKVLLECGGNISEAARRLNMHRRTLQRKLSKRPVRQ